MWRKMGAKDLEGDRAKDVKGDRDTECGRRWG